MNWWLIAGSYFALGFLIISLCPYKKYHLSHDTDFSSAPVWKIYFFYTIIFLLAAILWPFVIKIFYTKPRTLLDEVEDLGTRYFQQGCDLPGETVKRISTEVISKFKQAAEQRSETIPGQSLLNISSKFMNVYEQFGEDMYREHLEYELEKYMMRVIHRNHIRIRKNQHKRGQHWSFQLYKMTEERKRRMAAWAKYITPLADDKYGDVIIHQFHNGSKMSTSLNLLAERYNGNEEPVIVPQDALIRIYR